jgi:hypothetical protein
VTASQRQRARLAAPVDDGVNALDNSAVRRLLPGTLLVLLLAAALLLWWRGPGAPLIAPPAPDRGAAAACTTTGATGDAPAALPPAALPATERLAVDAPDEPLLHCRVTGLLFAVPWTGAIQFEFDGHDTLRGGVQHYRERVVPGADGAFALRLPAWVAASTGCVATFAGDDPCYRSIAIAERAPAFAGSGLAGPGVLELRTEIRALVRGTVVHPTLGRVTAANVSAYLLRDGRPTQPRLAVTSTNARGDFELQVPAAGDLLLVAVAMQQAHLGPRPLTTRGGAIATGGERVAERQPACVLCTARLGAATNAPPLVLGDSARLDVSVVDGSGALAADVPLHLECAADAALDYGVVWWRDGTCAAMSSARTDARGSAALLGAAHRRALLYCDGVPGREVTPPDAVRLVRPSAPR